ncbi:uncharacterized protein PEZ65_021927 [Lycodopsis pacificus]
MGGKTSNTVNITVTAGPVILESPVHPVTEGEATALSCRVKQASPNLTAEFFKDGRLMERSSTENVNILSVSKSNEGLYKCRIPGAGESPGSWLTVREPHHGPDLLLLLCIGGVGVFFVALLLLVGLLQCRKRPTITTDSSTRPSSFQSSSSPQTVYGQVSVAVPVQGVYAVVTKARLERDIKPGQGLTNNSVHNDKEPGGSSHCTRIVPESRDS